MKTHLVLAAILASAGTCAATETFVSLAGKDDAIPKLGVPGIEIVSEGTTQSEAILVSNALRADLAKLVHTRERYPEDPADYILKVRVEVASQTGKVFTVPFSASLRSPSGDPLWEISGRVETTDPPADPSILATIGRNVVWALTDDGWLQPRYDPDDPPPPPPHIRKDDTAS